MVKVIGFSAEYVETMTPAERKLYWMYYDRDKEEERRQQSGSNNVVPIGVPAPLDPGNSI